MILQHEFGTFCGDRYVWKRGQNINRPVGRKNSKNLSKHLHVYQKLGGTGSWQQWGLFTSIPAIVRPSIIGASLEEPCPDWVDNIYGATGTFIFYK